MANEYTNWAREKVSGAQDGASAPRKRRGRKPANETAPTSSPDPTAADLILTHFRERYRPAFRRGLVLFSSMLGREVAMREACAGANDALLAALATAWDAPRNEQGGVARSRLPALFASWSRTAWVNLMDELPEEDAAAIDTAAREEFRQLVRQALFLQVTLGEQHRIGGARTERRSLIGWCERFAKPGRWQSIRSYCCYCRINVRPDGEEELQIALRQELFVQIAADRRLVELGAKRFALRAVRYGVARKQQGERPGGKRGLVLDAGFVRSLRSDPVSSARRKEGMERAHARARTRDPEVSTSQLN